MLTYGNLYTEVLNYFVDITTAIVITTTTGGGGGGGGVQTVTILSLGILWIVTRCTLHFDIFWQQQRIYKYILLQNIKNDLTIIHKNFCLYFRWPHRRNSS